MSGRNNRIVRNRERSNDFKGNFIKVLIGLVILILLISICVIIYKKQPNSKKEIAQNFEENGSSLYEYFMLSSKENIGVIDKKANMLIEPKYTKIDIPNPAKDVFFCYTEDGNYQIFNQKAEEILTQFDQVEVIQSTNENRETEKNALKYKQNDLYGLIDLNGNVITEPIYQQIQSMNDKPGNLLIQKDNQYGVLDVVGNTIIEPEYDSISADGYCSGEDLYQKTGYIVSQKTKDGVNFGYIDFKGNQLLDVQYESLERALEYEENDIYLIAMQKGKKGVFKNKKKIIDFNFQDIQYSDFSNIFIVNKNGKYGFYNTKGKNILKPEYDQYTIAGNYISVEKNKNTQLFDVNGNLVNTSSYTKMIETENPAYFIAEDEEGFYSIISKDVTIEEKYVQIEYAFEHYFIITDETGKTGVINAITKEIEIKPVYDFIIQIEGTKVLQAIDGTNNRMDIYAKDLDKTITMEDAIVETLEGRYGICYSENEMKYFNQDGEIVENTEVYPDKKLYATCQNDKWGFCDLSGKQIVECQYDIVTEYNQYGFAGIKKDGKWGVANENGEIIVEPSYELDTYYFPQFIGKYRLMQSEIVYCEEV